MWVVPRVIVYNLSSLAQMAGGGRFFIVAVRRGRKAASGGGGFRGAVKTSAINAEIGKSPGITPSNSVISGLGAAGSGEFLT